MQKIRNISPPQSRVCCYNITVRLFERGAIFGSLVRLTETAVGHTQPICLPMGVPFPTKRTMRRLARFGRASKHRPQHPVNNGVEHSQHKPILQAHSLPGVLMYFERSDNTWLFNDRPPGSVARISSGLSNRSSRASINNRKSYRF